MSRLAKVAHGNQFISCDCDGDWMSQLPRFLLINPLKRVNQWYKVIKVWRKLREEKKGPQSFGFWLLLQVDWEREREDSRIDKSALIAVSRRCRSKTWSNKTGKMRPATGDTTTLYRERERDLSIGWKEGVYPFEMTGKNRIFMGAWLVYTRKESTWSREITERKEKKRFWRHIIFPQRLGAHFEPFLLLLLFFYNFGANYINRSIGAQTRQAEK